MGIRTMREIMEERGALEKLMNVRRSSGRGADDVDAERDEAD